MNEILKTFRLGVINLLGVTVPGLILILLLLFGCFAPSLLFFSNFNFRTMQVNSLAITPATMDQVQNQQLAVTNVPLAGMTVQAITVSSNPPTSPKSSVTASTARLISTLKTLPPIGEMPSSAALVVLLILAYVIGYTLRLSSPDELDAISIEKVLSKMDADRKRTAKKRLKTLYENQKILNNQASQKRTSTQETDRLQFDRKSKDVSDAISDMLDIIQEPKYSAAKIDHWPHHGEADNKFPYFHFQDYLTHRELTDLAKTIEWGTEVRSKTFVNNMKLEIMLRCPQLSTVVDSNEAHSRMLFGVWYACRFCRFFMFFGFGISMIGLLFSPATRDTSPIPETLSLSYAIWSVITCLLSMGTVICMTRIERLFHYRRVRELFDVVACYHLACRGFDSAGRPKP